MILYAIKSRRKVSQSLFKNRKQRFYQELWYTKFWKTDFLKIALALIFLRNFDIILISCNILSSCKVVKFFSNGWKSRFQEGLQNAKFHKFQFFLKIVLTAGFLWSFDTVMILPDIKNNFQVAQASSVHWKPRFKQKL